MPTSLNQIRKEQRIARTPKDAGWALTIEVGAYDNGMISVNGRPINESPEYDPVRGWVGAVVNAAQHIEEFRAEVERRRRDKTTA